MKRSAVTIRDVAIQARVHFSTVSRALSPATRHLVNPQLAERVQQAANDLCYSPNPHAVGLKTKRAFLIGVLVPDLTDPVFPPVVIGVRKRLASSPYIAIVGDADRPAGNERHSVLAMKSRSMAGVILATPTLGAAFVREATNNDLQVVQVFSKIARAHCSDVTIDERPGMRLVVDHLMRLGHRRFAYLAGPPGVGGAPRLAGLRAALRDRGLENTKLAVNHAAQSSIEAGRAAAERFFVRKVVPSAIVAANDFLALGVLDAVRELGLSCPGDVSVIGFGDIPLMDRMSPPLTTLRVDGERIGWCAADLMVRAIGPAEEPVHITVEPTLVVRSSTGPAKDRA